MPKSLQSLAKMWLMQGTAMCVATTPYHYITSPLNHDQKTLLCTIIVMKVNTYHYFMRYVHNVTYTYIVVCVKHTYVWWHSIVSDYSRVL